MANPTAPMLGKARQAARLANLLCTGEKEIKLKSGVCAAANRASLEMMMADLCSAKCLWTINQDIDPIGMLILRDCSLPRFRLQEIWYVVIDPNFRGKGFGSILVRRIQAMRRI